jgi:hypothetical protein
LPFALAAALGLLAEPSITRAVEVRGQTYFEQPPLLLNASTTENQVFLSGATYYFTLSVPEGSGEPLQRVDIVQRDGESSGQRIRFDADESQAFVGRVGDRGEDLPLSDVNFDRDTRTTSVTFAEPVPAGTTVTIGLEPVRNPRQQGAYLFGVTAFPPGNNPSGQFLGYGRLHFYGGDGPFPFSLFRD